MLMVPKHQTRNAECGTRNSTASAPRRTTCPCGSAFRDPRSAFVSSHQLQHTHPVHVLPISPQPHPSVAATPDELPRPPQPSGEHFVHEQIEAHPPADVGALPLRPRHAERHAKPALQPPPGTAHTVRLAGRVARRPPV